MAFTFAAFCYIVAFITSMFLIFLSAYQAIAFDELKSAYQNPIDHCRSMNPLVLPEYVAHSTVTLLFLASGSWISFGLNCPLVAYHCYRYKKRPSYMTKPGLYDPTTVMNRKNLDYGFKEGLTKTFFYFGSFFGYLFGLVYALAN